MEPDPVGGRTKAAGARSVSWMGLAGAVGVQGVIAATHPVLAAGLVSAELALVYVLVMTVVFGSEEHGERVFRLLRWAKGKPEPPVDLPSLAASTDGARIELRPGEEPPVGGDDTRVVDHSVSSGSLVGSFDGDNGPRSVSPDHDAAR